MVTYPALFEPDEGGFVVTFPDFGWGVTEGDNEQEALGMASDLLATIIAEEIRNNKDLPNPSHRRGRKYRLVSLSGLASAKVDLHLAFRASRMTKSELSRRTGIQKTNIDRLFDLEHHSRLDQIEAAFNALGKRMVISIEDAA